MKIIKEQVKQIAEVARIELSVEEVATYTQELGNMVKYADQLSELNTDDVNPTAYVMDTRSVMRKDEGKQWLTQEEALNNAPDQQDGHFKVPSIME